MARFEQCDHEFDCPACGQKGKVKINEPENPVYRPMDTHTSIDAVMSGNFQLFSGKLTCECGAVQSMDRYANEPKPSCLGIS